MMMSASTPVSPAELEARLRAMGAPDPAVPVKSRGGWLAPFRARLPGWAR